MSKRALYTLWFTLMGLASFAQKNTAFYLQARTNATLHDRTLANNRRSVGVGFQFYMNNNGNISPVISLSRDLFLFNHRADFQHTDGTWLDDMNNMTFLSAGVSCRISEGTSFSFTAGPALTNNADVSVGFKPSFDFYFPQNRNWKANLAYEHIFNREPVSKRDFGGVSAGIAFRLF